MKKTLLRYLILCVIIFTLILLFFFHFQDRLYVVQVVSVIDGDTVQVMVLDSKNKKGKELITVRLAYIDTPELKQRSFDGVLIGKLAKEHLEKFIQQNPSQSKHFALKIFHQDRYGRTIGELIIFEGKLEGKLERSLSLMMVKEGWAIIYPYSKFTSQEEKHRYLQMFNLAVRSRKGMWQTFGFDQPYYFRKNQKNQKKQ